MLYFTERIKDASEEGFEGRNVWRDNQHVKVVSKCLNTETRFENTRFYFV